MPPHFSSMVLPLPEHWNDVVKKIDQWVYENLNSRYCLKTTQILDNDRKIVNRYVLGVEESKELTMFTLKCPHINKE